MSINFFSGGKFNFNFFINIYKNIYNYFKHKSGTKINTIVIKIKTSINNPKTTCFLTIKKINNSLNILSFKISLVRSPITAVSMTDFAPYYCAKNFHEHSLKIQVNY